MEIGSFSYTIMDGFVRHVSSPSSLGFCGLCDCVDFAILWSIMFYPMALCIFAVTLNEAFRGEEIFLTNIRLNKSIS